MTRVLSELLGANELSFRQGIKQLERASGAPSADIRLSSEVNAAALAKLRELGLDPHDTTGRELYQALMERVKRDDKQLKTFFAGESDQANVALYVRRLIETMHLNQQCFALKTSTAKKLLKKYPPKRVMSRLGYRSVESMLKHEPAGQLYGAAKTYEPASWQKQLVAAYKKLSPSDFESKQIDIAVPAGSRWQPFAQEYVTKHKNAVLSFKELGVIVLLPMDAEAVEGAALAMTVLTLNAINDIRSVSAYLKLHQVRPDFGNFVAHITEHEAVTQASLAGQPLPWRLVHHYFARHEDAYSPEVFAPHVQPEDLAYQPADEHLANLHPMFEFWRGSNHIGFLHEGQAVSLNLADAVLNFCNKLPYEQRLVRYFRDHLWHELMLKYLHEEQLAENLKQQLSDELIDTETLA